MTTPNEAPIEFPDELGRARAALATVATWGTQLGRGIRLTAVEAFDAVEDGASGGYPPADVPESNPGLTHADAAGALSAACADLAAAADTAPGRQALACARAARILAAAGFAASEAHLA